MSWALPLTSGEMAHALGPQQWWTDNSKTVSLMLSNIYSLEGWMTKKREEKGKGVQKEGLYNKQEQIINNSKQWVPKSIKSL